MASFYSPRPALLGIRNTSIIFLSQLKYLALVPARVGHPLASSSGSLTVSRRVLTTAKRDLYRDEDRVIFDGEDEWDDQNGLQSRTFLQQTFRVLGLVTNRLTDIALQFAPEGASVQVVRTAVSGGLVLLAFSFVKGILSFFLTIGTIILGAYVAVRVFGLDVGSVDDGRTRKSKSTKGRGVGRRNTVQLTEPKLGRPSGIGEFLSVFSSDTEDSNDGLLDVWFESKGRKSKSR